VGSEEGTAWVGTGDGCSPLVSGAATGLDGDEEDGGCTGSGVLAGGGGGDSSDEASNWIGPEADEAEVEKEKVGAALNVNADTVAGDSKVKALEDCGGAVGTFSIIEE